MTRCTYWLNLLRFNFPILVWYLGSINYIVFCSCASCYLWRICVTLLQLLNAVLYWLDYSIYSFCNQLVLWGQIIALMPSTNLEGKDFTFRFYSPKAIAVLLTTKARLPLVLHRYKILTRRITLQNIKLWQPVNNLNF